MATPFCSAPSCWCRTRRLLHQANNGQDGECDGVTIDLLGVSRRGVSVRHARPPHLGSLIRSSTSDLRERLEQANAVKQQRWFRGGGAGGLGEDPEHLPPERARPAAPTSLAPGSRGLLSPGVATTRAKTRMGLERGIGSPMASERISDLDGASCSMSFFRGGGGGHGRFCDDPSLGGGAAVSPAGSAAVVAAWAPESPARAPRRGPKAPGAVCGHHAAPHWQRTLGAPGRLGTNYATKMRELRSKGGAAGRLQGRGLMAHGPASAPELLIGALDFIAELDDERVDATPQLGGPDSPGTT